MMAAPAIAGSITMSFAGDDGTTAVMTFNEDGTAKVEGADGTFEYTWDAEANKLCGDATGEGEVCAIFADKSEPSVGLESAYTTSDGGSGTATITAMSE